MAESRCSGVGAQPISNCTGNKETVCIDTYRVLDACRDKDCFEDVNVYLTDFGQEIVNRTDNIRCKSAEILWTSIQVDPIQFNRGFYQINIRYYVRLSCEACPFGGRPQDFEGITAVEKKVILYGSEGCVNIYRSSLGDGNSCGDGSYGSTNLPIATVEVASPVVLGTRVVTPRPPHCCSVPLECFPDNVRHYLGADLQECDGPNRHLLVSLGFFSIVRIERPAQYLVNVTEYSIPDKECCPDNDDDPCSMFRTMPFPVNDFYPPSLPNNRQNACGGNCNNGRR